MMDNLPQPNALILVAFVPSPRDLEVARVLGWYRIPPAHCAKGGRRRLSDVLPACLPLGSASG